MPTRNTWSESETILAFYYYFQIPFGKIHKTNPTIIRIAELIGRTPSAVVFKMGNLAHFDAELKKRNVNGLSNASKLDSKIVDHFLNDWENLDFRAKEIEAQYQGKAVEELLAFSVAELPEGIAREQLTTAQVNQQFFRDAVLSSYKNTCCITGFTIPTLLIASHIKPWSVSDRRTERINPSNGLCLNALHDKAFDKGLITVLPDFTVRVSSKLNGTDDVTIWIRSCDREKIILPEKFISGKDFLQYHNAVVFKP